MSEPCAAPSASSRAVRQDTRRHDAIVVVPMYNEAQVIATVLSDLRTAFAHIVCVDDGSHDGSADIAELAGATVLRHPINLGQGASLQTGIAYALSTSMDYVVTFDADGQHRVSDAVAMLDLARQQRVDVVLGSRFLQRSADAAMPAVRRQVLRAALLFTRITTGLPLSDTHNGLRVLSRSAARRITITLHGMAHASEILSIMSREGISFVEAPVSVDYTEYSITKGQSSLNAVNILFDLLLARARSAP